MTLKEKNLYLFEQYFKNPNKLFFFNYNLFFQNSFYFVWSNLNFTLLFNTHFLIINNLDRSSFFLKKNNYQSYLNSFFLRRSLLSVFRKKYTFAFRYKFSKVFRFINLKGPVRYNFRKLCTDGFLISNKINKLSHSYNFTSPLSKNFFFLTGNLNNPNSWTLNNFKFNKLANTIFLKKKSKYTPKTSTGKKKSTKSTFFNKKMLVNNFFYVSKNKSLQTSSLLKNFYFVKSFLKRKNRRNLSKPYLFMNNNSLFKVTYFFNKKIYNTFKRSSKVYNLLKKLNFKKKNKIKSIFFKFKFNSRPINQTFFGRKNYNLFFFKNTITTLNTHEHLKFKSTTLFRRNLRSTRLNSFFRNFGFLNLIFKKKKKLFLNFFKDYRFRLKKLIRFKKFNLSLFFKNNHLMRGLNYLNFKIYLNSCYYKNTDSAFNIFFKKIRYTNFIENKLVNYSLSLFKTLKIRPLLLFSKSPFFLVKKANFWGFDKIKINTKTKYNLSFGLNGFLFLTSSSYFSSLKKENTFLLKKTLYSFSYKNEMQRYILRKYLKSKFVLLPSKVNTQRPNSPVILNNPLNNGFKNDNNWNSFSYDNCFDLLSSSFSMFTGNLKNKNWLASNIDEYYSTTLFDIDYTFSIKRVKFKPGYMTMWRSARETLKKLLELKFKYQSKLTKYLIKFKKSTRVSSALILEMRLSNILFKSKILPDTNYIDLFLKNNLIYINGVVCSNPNFHLFVGDFIQLVINSKYYILHRWMLHWAIQKKTRLRLKSKRKMTSISLSDDKQQSNLMPDWILRNKNLITDCSKFLEVDYFTLSISILYEPFNLLDVNPYNFINVRYGIINLYNWKYIT